MGPMILMGRFRLSGKGDGVERAAALAIPKGYHLISLIDDLLEGFNLQRQRIGQIMAAWLPPNDYGSPQHLHIQSDPGR